MDIYTRVENLEKLVDSLVTTMNNNKFYTDADISGVRKNVSDITPYEDTKTAYIEDKEVVFFNVPEGALLVSFSNGNRDYTLIKMENNLKVEFEPLEEVATITIKIQ